jgi:hypothetical protein
MLRSFPVNPLLQSILTYVGEASGTNHGATSQLASRSVFNLSSRRPGIYFIPSWISTTLAV